MYNESQRPVLGGTLSAYDAGPGHVRVAFRVEVQFGPDSGLPIGRNGVMDGEPGGLVWNVVRHQRQRGSSDEPGEQAVGSLVEILVLE